MDGRGTRLGPYQLVAELGRGGMGKVYRAEVRGSVPGLEPGHAVALKVIHAHLLETPGFFKRFLREADLGRTIEHENVVRTYDCDALLHDGVQYNFLVMEFVQGQTLRDLLAELERVPEELCRHIGREVARGLAAIHEVGAVHRDLKPENVLITPDHVVKIMDLGVARLQTEAIRLSQTGAFLGSLEYAAPEQLQSAGGEPDERADLHALGIVLYELATGRHPFRDEETSKLLRNILEVVPRKAGELNPQLSPFFEEVLQALLAKDRSERFATAADLAGVLEEGEESAWWNERAKALRHETKRPLRRIRIPRETALHGRDDDLARLHALYEKAGRGDGQVLILEGEAGIGKTRLVDEFVGRLRGEGEDVNFLFGSYPPGGAATVAGAFSTAYREHFGAEDLEDTLRTYLGATPILVPAFAALLRGESAPTGAEALAKDSLQTVFVEATRGLAAERTTVVLIDDLHFAPEEGRALFSSLAMAVPGHRILLVGTTRPGLSTGWSAGVTRLDHVEIRPLARLGPRELGKLLREALRSDPLAEELGWRIAEKSDGNPFFAFEIIRSLRENRLLAQRADGAWITTDAIHEIEVPSSVVDLVRARLAALTERERELLDVAACCGFSFSVGLVADVVGVPRIPALRAFALLESAHRLVRSQGRVFVFDHHQIHEVLYDGLPDELREAYHAEIGSAIEHRERTLDRDADDAEGELCVDLCTHFLAGAQGARAEQYLDTALRHLEEGFLNEQALDLATRALDVPGLLQGERRLQVLLRMGDRLDLLGRREAQERVLEEATRIAEALGDESALAAVAHSKGALLWGRGEFREALPCFERSLELARRLGTREQELNTERSLGTSLFRLSRLDEAMPHFERCLALAREADDKASEASASINMGNVSHHLGRHEEARELYERGLALARAGGNRRWEAAALGNLGAVAHALGRPEESTSYQERYAALAREIGYRQGEASALVSLGNDLWELGRYEEGMARREQALAIAREIGDRHLEAIALVNLGSGWWTLGRLEQARDALEASLALCREIGARYPEGYALWSLGFVAYDEGDLDAAIARAREALALRREIRHEDGVAESLVQLGTLLQRAERFEAAREALEEALTFSQLRSRPTAHLAILANLACLPGGRVEPALAALEKVETDEAGVENRWLLWKATGEIAHLAEARRLLDEHVQRIPEPYRESTRQDLRLHRDIVEAWAEHEEEAGEADAG